MTETLLVVLKLSVVALILAIGLGSTPADLGYLWRRPAQLLRSLLAMYVAVPVAALVLVKTLPLPAGVKTAALVLAISAGAPLLPRKLMKLGREGYVFSLVVTSSLLAAVAVPAWLAALGPLFGREATVDPRAVALLTAKAFLVPLVLGMLLRRPLSSFADRLSEWILGAGGAVLVLCGVAKKARGPMKIDMHVHVAGRGKDISQVDDNVFFYPEDNNTLFTGVLYRLVEKYLGEAGADFDQRGTVETNEYLSLIYTHLANSKEIEGMVLLGLDALYSPKSGRLDRNNLP